MFRLIFKGQFVVRFLNPPIKHQLGEAAPLVKANVDIVAWYALQWEGARAPNQSPAGSLNLF